jgi:RND family efflux transporter MFP subunit
LVRPGHNTAQESAESKRYVARQDTPGGWRGDLPLPGQKVEPGRVLALIQPVFSDAAARVAEAEAEFIRSKAAFEQAAAAYNRVRKLAAAEAKSERELEEATATFAGAKARYEAAAALRSTYREAGVSSTNSPGGLPAVELRAPIAGVINSIGAGLGEPVAAEHKVFTILNPDILWIEVSVPEISASRLSAAKGAAYERPDARGEFHDVLAGGGKLVFAGLQVDPGTRTVPLIYEVHNAGGKLRAGQSLTVHVETASVKDALAIPDSAVVDEDGKPVVFVQVSGETFEKRNVSLDSGWELVAGSRRAERGRTHCGSASLRVAPGVGLERHPRAPAPFAISAPCHPKLANSSASRFGAGASEPPKRSN